MGALPSHSVAPLQTSRRQHWRGYNERSFGRDFVHFATERLPELAQLREGMEGMDDAVRQPLSVAIRDYREQL
jgi:hypothetical protein